VARGAMISAFGVPQPGPVPQFSRTPGATGQAPRAPGVDRDAVMRDWLGVAG
jgi:alpha-methylacyl-CoA racemase